MIGTADEAESDNILGFENARELRNFCLLHKSFFIFSLPILRYSLNFLVLPQIKFLKTKEGCAMVQMGDALAVERAVANLNNTTFFSCKMQLG